MPTATDALQAAADELHGATVAMYEVRDEVRTKLTQNSAAATTVITNFLRAGQKTYFFDAIAGNDANDGLSNVQAKRTFDACLDAIEVDGTTIFGAVVLMLTNGVMRYHHAMPSPVTVIGAEWGGGAFGGFYRPVTRTLSFQAEAMNSPAPGIGRTVPCIRSNSTSIRLQSLAIDLPDVSPTLDQRAVLNLVNGGVLIANDILLTCATAGSGVSLLGVGGPATIGFQGTLGNNAAGHVFAGIAAGQNPNNNFYFRTNLTSA